MAPKLKLKLTTKASSPEASVKKQSKKEKLKTPKIKIKPLSFSAKETSSSSTPTIKIPLPKSTQIDTSSATSTTTNSSLPLATSSTHGITLNLKKRTPTIVRVKPSRIPGEGYDSEDPDQEDDPLMEESIVLRMLPDESLDQLRQSAESGTFNGISLKWKDKRRAILKINGVMYGGKLVDLPTITEVFKTIDKKNLFKTVDVCQILIIVKKLDNERDVNDIEVDYEFGETFPHGLSYPLENFKSKTSKKYKETVVQNVEDEVERLLKMDEEAESTSYEFIERSMLDHANTMITPSFADIQKKKKSKKKSKKERKQQLLQEQQLELQEKQQEKQQQQDQDQQHSRNATTQNDSDMDIDDELDKLMGEEDNEGEGGEEDDEEEEDDDLEMELNAAFNETTKAARDEEDIPVDEDEEEIIEGAPEDGDDNNNQTSEDDDDDDEEDEEEDDGNALRPTTTVDDLDESKQHNAIIKEEISELETTIEQKMKDYTKAFNPLMKGRINDVISSLKAELERKKGQLIKETPEQDEDGDDDEEDEEEQNNNDDKEGHDDDGDGENNEEDIVDDDLGLGLSDDDEDEDDDMEDLF